MGFSIRGIGTAVPSTRISQIDSLQIARAVSNYDPQTCDTLDRLYPKTCIEQRFVVQAPALIGSLLGDHAVESAKRLHRKGGPSTDDRVRAVDAAAGPLAEAAVRQALTSAAIEPNRVTHLITISSTVGSSPGFDRELIRRLNLNPRVQRTHVGMMMCQAAINGLRVASAFASADESAVVLMCALEICSAHYDLRPSPKKLVTNAIFSDGAAALIGTAGSDAAWHVDACGGLLLHEERDNLRVGFGDQGLDISLSTKVPGLIEHHLGRWIAEWLRDKGLCISDIRSWAVHPGGPKVLTAAACSMGVTDHDLADSWNVLARYGNMSSPTVLFILQQLYDRQADLPCVMIAFGPGLTIECALIGRSAVAGIGSGRAAA